MSTAPSTPAPITERETRQIQATASGRPPVVFIHGLWLLPLDSKDPERGHALTIDGGWREVAEKALAVVKRFVSPDGSRSAGKGRATVA
jgi:hypothetical protein